jgi:hypothetical protein
MTTITMPLDISESSGDTACFVGQQRENCYELLQESNVLRLVEKGTLQQLYEIFKECSSAGWDGEQAKPISPEVLQNAIRFLFSFPSGIEAPDICAEPDGAITLEWYRSPNKVISISINPDGWVYWAALIGTSRRHGADYAVMGISDDLLKIISQVTGGN